jgi:hypothetical protein
VVQLALYPRTRAGRPDARRQGGFIAILVLVILVVGSLYLVVSGLGNAAAEAELQRGDVTGLALQQAKEALIARAALDRERPGSLSCPDRNNDGIAESPSGTPNKCPTYVGRLPWKTLGLPDLRDASGERLWYALSEGFTDSDDFVINSDTPGTLTVPGVAPSGGIVAIVFAPGRVLGTQTRGGPPGTCTWAVDDNCRVANYLEGQNATIDTAYEQTPRCERADCPGGYPINDQLLVITHADLFVIVEPVVARRIEKEIVPQLTNGANGYFEVWGQALYGSTARGFFPFATAYDSPNRPQDDYLGVYGQTNGLLPVTSDASATRVVWNAPPSVGDPDPPTISVLSGAGTVTFNPGATCSVIPATVPPPPAPPVSIPAHPACTFDYTCQAPACTTLQVRFQARLQRVTESLLINPSAFLDPAPPAAWRIDGVVPPSPNHALVLSADGGLRVTFDVTLPPTAGVSRTVLIEFPAVSPRFSDLTDPVHPSYWFVRNEWHRQTYYAVSDAFKPRGDLETRIVADACTAVTTPPPCINVVTAPPKARAVLVLAGRHMGTGTRTYTIAEYFEDENRLNTPALTTDTPDYVFEQKMRSKTFNDRLVVVAVEP